MCSHALTCTPDKAGYPVRLPCCSTAARVWASLFLHCSRSTTSDFVRASSISSSRRTVGRKTPLKIRPVCAFGHAIRQRRKIALLPLAKMSIFKPSIFGKFGRPRGQSPAISRLRISRCRIFRSRIFRIGDLGFWQFWDFRISFFLKIAITKIFLSRFPARQR